jgi:succinoglycan biosynthesis transport protein ExoP
MNMIQRNPLDGLAAPAHHHNEENDAIDLVKFWKVIWRAKWNIAALVVIVTMLAVVAVLNLTPQYRATATLVIEDKSAPVLSFQQVVDPSNNTSEYLQTQLGLLQSRGLAERAVRKLDLTHHPLFDPRQQVPPSFTVRGLLHTLRVDEFIPALRVKEEVVQPTEADILNFVTLRLMDNISAMQVGKSQLLAVSVELPDAQLAANVANALAEGFNESQLDANLAVSVSTTNWMNSRLDELRQKLRAAENLLQGYREAQGLVDVDGVATISANELSETGNRMIDARRQRAEAESQYRQVQTLKHGGIERLASVPAVLGHPLIQQFKGDQARAQAKVDELSARYGDRHPAMIAARSDLTAATASLQAQVDLVVAGIERNYQLAQANENSLSASFDKNKAQIQDISRKEFKLRELQRDVDSSRVLYETFLTRLKETAATSDINSSNARIVDPAIAPLKPGKPNKSLIIAIAGILAGVIGIGLTLLFDALNNTFKNPEEVESKLNVPVLGIVPLVPKKNRKQIANLFEQNEDGYFCESIRTLRTSLILSALDTPRKVVLITSSVPGEGKSSIANNLAFSLAHIERVLLIDADLRQPTMARSFGFPVGQPGLANVIAGTAELSECIRTVGNVDMLCAGMVPPNPQELLSSVRLTRILEELKGRYERIIIDSPPTQAVSDPMLLANHADAVIYVIRAESTSIPLVQKGISQLLQNNAPLTGMVLNLVDRSRTAKSRYSYANYYQSYGAAPSKG